MRLESSVLRMASRCSQARMESADHSCTECQACKGGATIDSLLFSIFLPRCDRASDPNDKNTKIKKSKGYKEQLIPPDDDWVPFDDYFKDGRKLDKKNGHKLRCFNGKRGVAIPGERTGQPWKIRRIWESGVTKEDCLHKEQSDDDSEAADEINKQIVDDKEEKYNKSVVGITLKELLVKAAEDAAASHPGEDANGTQEPKPKRIRKDRDGFESESSSEDIKPKSKLIKGKPKGKTHGPTHRTNGRNKGTQKSKAAASPAPSAPPAPSQNLASMSVV